MPALRPDPRLTARLVAAASVSLLAWIAADMLAPREALEWSPQMRAAAGRMHEALDIVRRHHEAAGPPLDLRRDPNRTGMIGPEYSELFTTLGQLEAKRTTTNPDMAALLAHLLDRAGVRRGDTIAVGASGSFPALLVATVAAAEAIGAHPVTILSLGASSYGATDPDFDLLDLHRLLTDDVGIGPAPAAVSLGGARDVGQDFEPATRDRLAARVGASGVPLVREPDLVRNVKRRMEIYLGGPAPVAATRDERPTAGRIAAFVNIGGAEANVGVSPTILGIRPGLVDDLVLPPAGQRGALHEMAERGVRVIHLLNVRALTVRHGLPWDPAPLPEPGTTALRREAPAPEPALWVVAGVWLAALVILFTVPVMIPGAAKTSTLPKELDDVVP